jgi:cell division transport system permease protein
MPTNTAMARDYNPAAMAGLRALAYFFEEALTSLWRSRLVNAVSIGTIAVSLFVLGAFLTVASRLGEVVSRWTEKVQVIVYLDDRAEPRVVASLEERLRQDPAVEATERVSREQALARFRELFRDMSTLPDDLGENPFPASLEVNLKPGHQSPAEVQRLAKAFEDVPGVSEIQYDLLWIERLATGVRLVRGVGTFLGGVLALAGVFTISNVIRLTIYAREDELDIMRLVGATRAYVKGPFVAEGMLQGGLGGSLAVLLLWAALGWLSQGLASSELLGRTTLAPPPSVALLLVIGGMAVGLAGSLVSLSRLKV